MGVATGLGVAVAAAPQAIAANRKMAVMPTTQAVSILTLGPWPMWTSSQPPLSLAMLGFYRRYAFTLSGRKAGMTSWAKRVTCSLNWAREAPMGKAMRICSRPGYFSSISLR